MKSITQGELRQEARLRRKAKRLGYALERSNGAYRILDPWRVEVIAGEKARLSLDGAKEWLLKEEIKQLEEGAGWVDRLRRAGKLNFVGWGEEES